MLFAKILTAEGLKEYLRVSVNAMNWSRTEEGREFSGTAGIIFLQWFSYLCRTNNISCLLSLLVKAQKWVWTCLGCWENLTLGKSLSKSCTLCVALQIVFRLLSNLGSCWDILGSWNLMTGFVFWGLFCWTIKAVIVKGTGHCIIIMPFSRRDLSLWKFFWANFC